MAACISLEIMSGMILNWSQQKFAAKSVANEMWCLKVMQWPALTGLALIFNLRIFFSNLCKTIIYSFADQPSITEWRRSVLNFKVLSCHFSEVYRLFNEHWAKNHVQSENISTPICPMDKMYWYKICGLEFWYIASGLGIQLEQSKKNNPASKRLVQSCYMLQVVYSFFAWLICTHGLWDVVSWKTWVWFSQSS